MLIRVGEKLHLSMRRRFEGDLRRHFVGKVIEAQGTLVRAEGFFFIFDPLESAFIKKPEHRTTIFQLANAGYIVNILPREVDLEALRYVTNKKNILVVTDHQGFELDINEFGSNR